MLEEITWGQFQRRLPKILSEDSTVVAVIYGRFGVAFG